MKQVVFYGSVLLLLMGNHRVVSGEGAGVEVNSFVEAQDAESASANLVGVYYYPWHGDGAFHGRKYLREFLDPTQQPYLGEYNDRDPDVIRQHVAWSEYAGINLWVCSWWGPEDLTDITLRNHVMTNDLINDIQIALFYETTKLLTDRSRPGGRWNDVSGVAAHIQHMAEHYFDHPSYFRIDDRPVLFIYLTRGMDPKGILPETIEIMRAEAKAAGFDIYIVGDHVFGRPPSAPGNMALMDAVTNYDVYGSSGGTRVLYSTQEGVDAYYAQQAEWKALAAEAGVRFIPAVSPGYNDAGVRPERRHQPLSRKLSPDDAFGSLFKANLEGALPLTDPEIGNLFMVNSWNEWHEDTQIEPVALAPATNEDVSGTNRYTWGLSYEGYGMRYLDLLRDALNK